MSTDAALPVWLPPSEQLRCAREVLALIDITDVVGMLPDSTEEGPAGTLPAGASTTPLVDDRTRCRVYREPE